VVRRRVRLRTAAPWIAIWGLVAAALVFPESASIVARRIGVTRGADLVSYVGVIGSLAGFLWVSVRLRQQNRAITLLVRDLALADPIRGDGAEPEPELPF
jgi:hypothetical protein